MSASTPTFDLVVLGCGPAGERAAIQAARAGRSVAVIEKARVLGGARVNWGTIPSKTLRESALYVYALTRQRLHGIRCELPEEITVADFMHRERIVVQRELEIVNEALDHYRIDVFKGTARLVDPHTVAVWSQGEPERLISGAFVIIATGSSPSRPADVPFDRESVFDSDTILSLPRMPRSMVVLGAGVVGIEYASIFAALGLKVRLIDTRDRLLPYLDREIVGLLGRELAELGITLSHEDRYELIERLPGSPPRVRMTTKKGEAMTAEVLLYAVGRDGNSRNIGLETLGIVPNAYGLLSVNEYFQTIHPHVYAVGDVIGYPALASTSMEQGRRAVRHAFGLAGPSARTDVLPFAIYSIPEVSYIGETEEALKARGARYVVGRGAYAMNARGQIIGDVQGMLKLLFSVETERLLGVHIIGNSAAELVHVGEAWMKMGATANDIADSIYNYPTLGDLYRHAALMASLELSRQKGSGNH